jgi:WD40 repeat protein
MRRISKSYLVLALLLTVFVQIQIGTILKDTMPSAVILSFDGSYVLKSEFGNIFHLYDTQSGDELRQFVTDRFSSYPATFLYSPTTHELMAQTWGRVTTINVQNGQYIREFVTRYSDTTPTFSTDTHYVISAWGCGGQIWDIHSGVRLQRLGNRRCYSGETGPAHDIALSLDQKYAVLAYQTEAQLYDRQRRMMVHDYRFPLADGSESLISDIGFSLDSTRLLVGVSNGPSLLVDLGTGIPLCSNLSAGSMLRFSPDGKAIVIAHDESAHLWVADTCTLSASVSIPDGIAQVAFSPDSKAVFVQDNASQVTSWDLATGGPISTFTPYETNISPLVVRLVALLVTLAGSYPVYRIYRPHIEYFLYGERKSKSGAA